MDTNPINAEEVIPMTPSINDNDSDSPNDMASTTPDSMDNIRRLIGSYQPRTEFGRNALSTLLHAIDEIHSFSDSDAAVDYSTLIHMLRDDFPATSFITKKAINGYCPVLRIIKNALIQSGYHFNQHPDQPLIKALITELYGTSVRLLNSAKEFYQ
jgi:hypothetical protein